MEQPRPAAVPISESYRDLLEKKGFAHAATLGPEGEPHTSPVWYGWDGRHILFSHTKARQKFRNLRRDPRIALSILDPDDPYRYVEIRGYAEIEDDPDAAYIDEMAKKYLDEDTYPWGKPWDERVIVRVIPTHVTPGGTEHTRRTALRRTL